MVHFPLEVRAFTCHFHFLWCAIKSVSWDVTCARLGDQMATVVEGVAAGYLDVGWAHRGRRSGALGVVDRRFTLQLVIS